MTNKLKFSGIHHVALTVSDLDLVEDFYRQVLGLPFVTHQFDDEGRKRSAWFAIGQTVLMLELDSENKNHSNHLGWHLVALPIAQEERAAWIEKLLSHGVAISKETENSIYFYDPEGNHLALSHYQFN